MRVKNSLSNDKTVQLWKQFMPRGNEIEQKIGTKCYSIQSFPDDLTKVGFSPDMIFDKWAAFQVLDFKNIPDGMEAFTISKGKYAVFLHKGPASTFFKTIQYIFGEWLPFSEYSLDSRAHFEVLDSDNYNPNDPDAEEEVWIPIK